MRVDDTICDRLYAISVNEFVYLLHYVSTTGGALYRVAYLFVMEGSPK